MEQNELVVFENFSVLNQKAMSLPIGKVSIRQVLLITAGFLFATIFYLATTDLLYAGASFDSENAMLDWVRSLDGHQQWRLKSTHDHSPYPTGDRQFGEGMQIWNECPSRERVFRDLFYDWDPVFFDVNNFSNNGERSIASSHINPPPISWLNIDGPSIFVDGKVVLARDTFIQVFPKHQYPINDSDEHLWENVNNEIKTYTQITDLQNFTDYDLLVYDIGNKTLTPHGQRDITIHYYESGICNPNDFDEGEAVEHLHRAHFTIDEEDAVGPLPFILTNEYELFQETLERSFKIEEFYKRYGDTIFNPKFCEQVDCGTIPNDWADQPHILSNIGSVLATEGKFTESSVLYKQALKVSPTDNYVKIGWANVLSMNEQFFDANKIYQDVLEENPNNLFARTSFATALATNGLHDRAIFQYQQVLDRNPNNIDAHNGLSFSYVEKIKSTPNPIKKYTFDDEYSKATFHNKQALKLEPNNEESVKIKQLVNSLTMDTNLPDSLIPSWIKNNAGWWANGDIDDDSFIQGMQYLIKQGIMTMPPTVQGSVSDSNDIPSWIKNNAGWWANGDIDDDSFIQGMQYLIKQGIIQV